MGIFKKALLFLIVFLITLNTISYSIWSVMPFLFLSFCILLVDDFKILKIRTHALLYNFFIISLIIAISFRLTKDMVFEFYYIPSKSMESTLIPGDVIIVKKTGRNIQGLIQTKFQSKKNSKYYQSLNRKIKSENIEISNHIRKNSIKSNDVIVCKRNADKEAIVKRCVGLPGDTIFIDSSVVYINSKLLDKPSTVLELYEFEPDCVQRYISDINQFLTRSYLTDKENILALNKRQLLKLREEIPEKLISKYYNDTETAAWACYKKNEWTPDFFGPLIIPEKDMEIELTRENYLIYQQTIAKYEGRVITAINDSIYLDGVFTSSYTFRNNYYFVMGDYRYNSRDSRYIGFFPEKNILGKTKRVLFSIYDNKINHGRFLLKIE